MMILKHSIVRFVIGIISLSLCVGFIRSIYTQIRKEDRVGERKASYEREVERNAELKKRLNEATSSAFIEKLAREKLGLVKEADTVILLDTTSLAGSLHNADEKKLSNWQAWWSLFY